MDEPSATLAACAISGVIVSHKIVTNILLRLIGSRAAVLSFDSLQVAYNLRMASLSKTNRYLRDPQKRRSLVADSVRQSCVFEGARNLKNGASQTVASKRRSIASAKKSASKP